MALNIRKNFDFDSYRDELYKKVLEKNKKTSVFSEMTSSYQELYYKQKRLLEKNEFLERENLTLKKFTGDPLKLNEMESKVQELEKELSNSLKENKNFSSKFLDTVTDNVKLKENCDYLTNQNVIKQNRINELDEIVKNFENENNRLTNELTSCKSEMSKLELKNHDLNEKINLKIIENNSLVNEILKMKNEYVNKYNEMLDLLENARKKKEAADIYFDNKKKEYEKAREDLGVFDSIKDFQIVVEDMVIPHKLKIKQNAHRKNITSMKFNSFGTNVITTGMDGFIRIWDANKNSEIGIFSGFSMAVSDATYDNTEQLLIGVSLDKTAKVWSLKNNKLLNTFTGHIDYINCCSSFYSCQKFLSGGSDRTIKEWDLENLKLSKNYSCVSTCTSLGITFDDSNFFSGHLDGSLKIWSVGSDKPDNVIDAHDDRINYIELVKNENQILTSSKDYSIKLWDLRKMQPIYTIAEDKLSNYCESSISISTDKKYFSVGSTKGEIYVFSLATGELVDKYDNKSSASITSISWRPYHSQMFVGDANGVVTVWTNS